MSPYLSAPRAVGDTSVDGQARVKDYFPFIDADPASLPATLDPFTVNTTTGFLPTCNPVVVLPSIFRPLTDLVEAMPVTKLDGQPGLLATYSLGPLIDAGETLPDLSDEVDELVDAKGEADLSLVTAIFRDYAFLASAYLLEPCWERFSKGLEGYGLGRQVLPRCIAMPMVKTAKLLDIPAFMSYAAAYSLYNYHFENSSVGHAEYANLRMIRAFEYGLDPKSSEAGFVLTHVDMVKHTGGLITGAVNLLDGIAGQQPRGRVMDAFHVLLDTMEVIETSMERMWAHSKPEHYSSLRVFIFGITNQSMFPKGVIYEGVNDNHPMYFRGESGANDAIIPLLDHLLQVPMPQNPLTEILKEFRAYRPAPHRDFLTHVRERAEKLSVRSYCCQDVETAVLYLRLLDHVRSFRWRHWLFAREYIIKRSSHPTATGGSPIVTWLPNQLTAVMDLMCSVWDGVSQADKKEVDKSVVKMMENAIEQRGKLQREVERWCSERGVKS